MAKKLSKLQSFSANFNILGDFWEFFTRNHNYEFFQKGGLLRFDWRWSSLTSDALDQTPPPIPMGQTLFYFFGSREVWVNERRRAVRDCLKSSHNSHSMTFHPTLVVCWAVTADQYEPHWEIRNAALFPKCPLLRWTVDISRSMRISAVILPRIYKYW